MIKMAPMGTRPRRIVLHLEPGSPMRGRVRAAAGFDWPFTGWISLLGALEAAIGDDRVSRPRVSARRIRVSTAVVGSDERTSGAQAPHSFDPVSQ
jgi:hypothetical protein